LELIWSLEFGYWNFLMAAGGTTTGGTTAAGGTGGALKLSSARKGEGRHHPAHLLAVTFGAEDLLR